MATNEYLLGGLYNLQGEPKIYWVDNYTNPGDANVKIFRLITDVNTLNGCFSFNHFNLPQITQADLDLQQKGTEFAHYSCLFSAPTVDGTVSTYLLDKYDGVTWRKRKISPDAMGPRNFNTRYIFGGIPVAIGLALEDGVPISQPT